MKLNLSIYFFKATAYNHHTIKGYVFAMSQQAAVEMILNDRRIAHIRKITVKSLRYIKYLYWLSRCCFLALPKSKLKLFCVSEFVEVLSNSGEITSAIMDVQSQLNIIYYRYLFTLATVQLNNGISVSQALAGINLFTAPELRLIQAGEDCGGLLDVFSIFRDTMVYKVKSSSTLIWVVPILMAIGFLIILSFYVANNLLPYYRGDIWLQGKSFPVALVLFMGIYEGTLSQELSRVFFFGAFIVVVIFISRLFFRKYSNQWLEWIRLHMPVVKELYRMQQMVSFTIAFIMAKKTGLALHRAFAYSLHGVTCRKYIKQLQTASHFLENGVALEQVLLGCQIFSYSEKLMFQISFANAKHLMESLDYLMERRRRTIRLINSVVIGFFLSLLISVLTLLVSAVVTTLFAAYL